MIVWLSKIVPLILYPLSLVCILLIVSLILSRNPKWQRLVIFLALGIVWVSGNRWTALSLTRWLEGRYPPLAQLPEGDAIVVLGGGTEPDQPPRPMVEINGAGDRVLYAAWLYKQGVAPRILLSGGNIDWLGGRLHTPAEDMAQLLDLMEVPQDAIWMEGESRNTYENAAFSKRILQENNIRSIVLVTSAAHMPRSVMLFEEQGLDIIPAPTDFSVTEADWDQLIHANWAARWMDWIPSAANLSQTTSALKEILGIAIYSLRARIFD